MDTLLSLNGMSVTLGQQRVLDSISFSLQSGMILGLLGANGAGKTTLLRTIVGLESPSLGEIRVFDEPSTQLSIGSKQHIGYVPQVTFGYEGFSVAEALRLHASFYPQWDEQLQQRWCERFQLNIHDAVDSLSVGQRQALALIMAMAYRPKLLVMDEPMASLDPMARRTLMCDLFELALDTGAAVIISSHITADLERVASHIALLKQGRLHLFDELEHLRETSSVSLDQWFLEQHP